MKDSRSTSTASKDILFYLPLIVLYIVIVLLFSSETLVGDESRHVNYAINLAHGSYEDVDDPNFRNGPGYPLALTPFIAMGSSLIFPKLLNAFFLIMAVVYFKKTIALFTRSRFAFIPVYLIALYPPVLRWIPFLYSEAMVFFVMCGLIYHVCKLFESKVIFSKQLGLASFYLGLLVLTKIIYLQVILVCVLLLAAIYLYKRTKTPLKALLILLGGFAFITPYLLYTFSLTGKVLYTGSGSGEILYHRSTPFESEWGNWFSRESILFANENDHTINNVYGNLSELSENHRDLYLKLEPLSYIERDSAFTAEAIKNMKAHPKKYLKNTMASLSRLVFHYPFSYRNQSLKTYGYMIPNMVLLFLWALSLYPFMLNRKRIPFEITALMVFSLIYIGGIVLLDGRGRNFICVVPALVLFFTYIYSQFLKIKFVGVDNTSLSPSNYP